MGSTLSSLQMTERTNVIHIAENVQRLLEGARWDHLLVASFAVDRARGRRIVHNDQAVHVGVEMGVVRQRRETTNLCITGESNADSVKRSDLDVNHLSGNQIHHLVVVSHAVRRFGNASPRVLEGRGVQQLRVKNTHSDSMDM